MAAQDPLVNDEFFVADKDPDYVYKWCNTRERVMMRRSRQGYEVVNTPEDIPAAVRALSPALTPGGEMTRRRGDLILMRIRKDLHAKNVAGPIRDARERHNVSLDTMIQQANEQAQRALRAAGYPEASVRASHVFADSPEPFKQ
jgi:hypothetical protein